MLGANRFYEVKYFDPDGIVVDITESGWSGAVKNVVADVSDKKTAPVD